MISDIIRKNLSRKLTGQDEIRLTKKIPDDMLISSDLGALDQIGIYLHIPFCDQICPYCPYNKEIIRKETTDNYTKAVLNEIARYAKLLDGKEVSSLYIGGGTPTSMLDKGIEEIIEAIYRNFNMRCAIHMESHPNHLTKENLDKLETLGVKYLSIGVEALQDRHLKVLERPYTVNEVKKNVERAVSRNFECVNIDYMFDLPDQKSPKWNRLLSIWSSLASNRLRLIRCSGSLIPDLERNSPKKGELYRQCSEGKNFLMSLRISFMTQVMNVLRYGRLQKRVSANTAP